MKNKPILILLLASQLCQTTQSVFATEEGVAVDPYVVTQAINYDVIDPDVCVTLIRSQSDFVDTTSEFSVGLSATIEQTQVEIEQLNIDYQTINNQIAALESGEDQSLEAAKWQLEQVVETLYHDYLETDESFVLLTQEEQLTIIAQHESVIEWQDYMIEIQQLINELIVERDAVETTYYQRTYDLENVVTQLEAEKSNQAQLNQCLLYPYSMNYLAVDQIMLNQQTVSLNDYLVELDYYLQRLVPSAYRKLSFYDIYRMFSYVSDDATITTDFSNKQPVHFDEAGLAQYTYAKELSLYDIEIVANNAKAKHLADEDLAALTIDYQNTLDLKAHQFSFFYQINSESFEWVKSQLADYLNQISAYDDVSIELVQTIHNRYQIKLVYFDEVNQYWGPSEGGTTGYYASYYEAPLLESLKVDRNSGNLVTEADSAFNETPLADEIDSESSFATRPGNENHLDDLKDKLSESPSSNTKPKSLAKPQELSSKPKEKTPAKSSQLKLPDTGEQQLYLYIGLGFLIIGLSLLFVNQRIRRKKRQKLEDIELD